MINRAEFTKIIINATVSEDEIYGENCFPDVKTEWFAKYICSAKRIGLIDGYPNGYFEPENNILFVEAAKIIKIGFGASNQSASLWYSPFLEALSQKKSIPTSITSLDKKITRGETVEMIWRIKENIQDQPSLIYENGALVEEAIPADEYLNNPDLNGQFRDTILVNRNPDCRAYVTDANGGDYGSTSIIDASNDISNAVSAVKMEMVIASNWNQGNYDYDNVSMSTDPEKATHCRMTSTMIPNHSFGVKVTPPSGGGWVNPIDHSDSEITYIPVNPVKTNAPSDTPRNPPIYDFDGILLNGVGIAMDSGFCYNPGVTTGPVHKQSNEAGNASGCGPQNTWFELPAYTIWDPEAEKMAAVFDDYFAHGFVGTYHYHALTHPLQEDDDQKQPPSNGNGSPVIGFAPDGFPIYGHWFVDQGNNLVKTESGYEAYTANSRTPITDSLHGTPPTPWDIENRPEDFASDFGFPMGRYEEDWYFAGTGNLDECNGAYDGRGDYGYYVTDKYPFAPPCIFGERDESFGKVSPTL